MAEVRSGFSARPFDLVLSVYLTSQDGNALTSTLYWELAVVRRDAGYTSFSLTPSANVWVVNIDGQEVSNNFTFDFRAYSSVVIATGTRTVSHNSDGTKSVYAAAAASSQVLGSATGAAYIALNPILVASVPGQITNLQVTGVSPTAVALWWPIPPANGSAIDRWWVQISSTPGFESPVYSNDQLPGAGVFSPLARYSDYFARVSTHNGIGWAPWSNVVQFRTAADPASEPRNVAVPVLRPNTATITWDDPQDSGGAPLLSYTIQWATDAAFSSPQQATVYGRSAVLSSLRSGTRYWVRIFAWTAAGQGQFSVAATFATPNSTKVGANDAYISGQPKVGYAGVYAPARIRVGVNGGFA